MHRRQDKAKAFLSAPPEIRVAKRAAVVGSVQEVEGVGRRTDWMHGGRSTGRGGDAGGSTDCRGVQ